jgi:hypothetical protein
MKGPREATTFREGRRFRRSVIVEAVIGAIVVARAGIYSYECAQHAIDTQYMRGQFHTSPVLGPVLAGEEKERWSHVYDQEGRGRLVVVEAHTLSPDLGGGYRLLGGDRFFLKMRGGAWFRQRRIPVTWRPRTFYSRGDGRFIEIVNSEDVRKALVSERRLEAEELPDDEFLNRSRMARERLAELAREARDPLKRAVGNVMCLVESSMDRTSSAPGRMP